MRRFVLVPLFAAGLSVLGATAALAAPPEVQQKSCEAGGGTFAKDHGTRSCTTTTVETVTTDPGPAPRETMTFGPFVATYTGTAHQVQTVQTTTVQTQKGNDVSTTKDATILSFREVWDTCQVDVTGPIGASAVEPVEVCENPSAYPLDGLFF